MPFTTIEVEEVWNANRASVLAHLTMSTPIVGSVSYKRIIGKAKRLADEQTKRQVGTDSWAAFTNERATNWRRPYAKVPDPGIFSDGYREQRSWRREEARNRAPF